MKFISKLITKIYYITSNSINQLFLWWTKTLWKLSVSEFIKKCFASFDYLHNLLHVDILFTVIFPIHCISFVIVCITVAIKFLFIQEATSAHMVHVITVPSSSYLP